MIICPFLEAQTKKERKRKQRKQYNYLTEGKSDQNYTCMRKNIHGVLAINYPIEPMID
jgi:hypothetical protein